MTYVLLLRRVPSRSSLGGDQVDALEDERELGGIHLDMVSAHRRFSRQAKSASGEAFGEDAKAARGPPEGFTEVVAAIEEDEQRAGQWVATDDLAGGDGEAIE
ncbi:MAG: hypothetical protein V2A73_19355 [Pseudomonadota bacterium]